jgi:hypothetical protein
MKAASQLGVIDPSETLNLDALLLWVFIDRRYSSIAPGIFRRVERRVGASDQLIEGFDEPSLRVLRHGESSE